MTSTTTKKPPEKLPRKALHASESASAEAREQANEYESTFASWPLELDDDDPVMIPPHPDYGMLDDDRVEAWEELMFIVDTQYEREPDILVPEQRVMDKDGKDTGIVTPSEVIRGALRRPFRIVGDDGKPQLVRPPHSVQAVIAALGRDEYDRLRKGGRCAADVWKIWSEQQVKIRERAQRDSKSPVGTLGVAPISEATSE